MCFKLRRRTMEKERSSSIETRTRKDYSEPRPPEEERSRMIAEAAYYRAERRGFQGGNPVEDWLAAEAEVDENLARRS
jgi:hypothetical protein